MDKKEQLKLDIEKLSQKLSNITLTEKDKKNISNLLNSSSFEHIRNFKLNYKNENDSKCTKIPNCLKYPNIDY